MRFTLEVFQTPRLLQSIVSHFHMSDDEMLVIVTDSYRSSSSSACALTPVEPRRPPQTPLTAPARVSPSCWSKIQCDCAPSALKHRSCSHINISMKQLTLHTARYPWESPTQPIAGGHLWSCGRRNWERVHSDGQMTVTRCARTPGNNIIVSQSTPLKLTMSSDASGGKQQKIEEK